MSPLRVAHVIDSLAETGGAERRLVEEVLALQHRADQLVVRLYERDQLQPRLAAAGIPVVALGLRAGSAGRTWPLAARRLQRVLADWRPDVVHTSLFSGNLVGQLAALPLRLPVVSTFNRTGDVTLQRTLQPGVAGWRGRVMIRVARWAAGRGNVRWRAVSAYAGETGARLLDVPPERITAVPRGVAVDLDPAAPVDGAALGLPSGGPLVLNAARLVPEKAQDQLVAAFATAAARLPAAHLVIAGAPGPGEPAVRAAVRRLGLDGRVHLVGFRPDVHRVMAAADVVVLSSLSEGSPSVVVEAMAAGTPVVAYGIPPVVELTDGGRAARLVPVGDVTALADAIVAAVTEPDPNRLAAASALAERASVAATAERLLDLLAATAGTRERAGAR